MIITRKKHNSNPGQHENSVLRNIKLDRVEKLGDDLVYKLADVADTGLNYAADANPVVDKATSKLRKRVNGFTTPIKKLISLKRKKKKINDYT